MNKKIKSKIGTLFKYLSKTLKIFQNLNFIFEKIELFTNIFFNIYYLCVISSILEKPFEDIHTIIFVAPLLDNFISLLLL